MSKKAVIYTRVSTVDQDAEKQIPDLEEYCKRRGFQVIKILTDKKSGKNQNREGFQEAMKLARQRRIDVFLVWKLSRFGRSFADSVASFQELDDLGVQIISYKEGIDSSGPMGKMIRNILATVAEWQREEIVENIKSGLEHAAKHGTKSGKPIGRPAIGHSEIKEVLTLYIEGTERPVDIRKKAGVSKTSYYKITNGYDELIRGKDPEKVQEDNDIAEKMMKRLQGITNTMKKEDSSN